MSSLNDKFLVKLASRKAELEGKRLAQQVENCQFDVENVSIDYVERGAKTPKTIAAGIIARDAYVPLDPDVMASHVDQSGGLMLPDDVSRIHRRLVVTDKRQQAERFLGVVRVPAQSAKTALIQHTRGGIAAIFRGNYALLLPPVEVSQND